VTTLSLQIAACRTACVHPMPFPDCSMMIISPIQQVYIVYFPLWQFSLTILLQDFFNPINANNCTSTSSGQKYVVHCTGMGPQHGMCDRNCKLIKQHAYDINWYGEVVRRTYMLNALTTKFNRRCYAFKRRDRYIINYYAFSANIAPHLRLPRLVATMKKTLYSDIFYNTWVSFFLGNLRCVA
jgi:hypothetical protein